jgi:branched-subunit amino acid transport protein
VLTIWVCIAATALISFTIKGAGPAILGQRPLSPAVQSVLALLAPALLFGLVVATLLGPDWSAVDVTMLAGVAVAVGVRLLGVPTLIAVAGAVAVTALLRAL